MVCVCVCVEMSLTREYSRSTASGASWLLVLLASIGSIVAQNSRGPVGKVRVAITTTVALDFLGAGLCGPEHLSEHSC